VVSLLYRIWNYICYCYSLLLYLFCLATVLYALVENETIFYEEIPNYGNIILFVVLLFLLGCLEGSQICFITLMKQNPETYKDKFPRTWLSLKALKSKPNNLERFLQGRQLLVTVIAFLLEQLTTIEGATIFPQWLQNGLLSTGLFGALVVVNTSQLSPRVIAINYPLYFTNRWFIHVIFQTCMLIEFVGFGYCAWLVSRAVSYFARLKVVEKPTTHELEEVLESKSEPNQLTLGEQLLKEDFDFVKHFSLNPFDEGQHAKENFTQLQLPDYSDPVYTAGVNYPSAAKLSQLCKDMGLAVPNFLLEPNNTSYIPPHVFACHLLVENQEKGQVQGNSSQHQETFATIQKPGALSNESPDPKSIATAINTLVDLLLPPQ